MNLIVNFPRPTVRFIAHVAALCCVVTTVAVHAAPDSFSDTKDLCDLPARWTPLMREFLVPGMAVGVVKDGKLHAVATFGHRDAAQSRAVTPDTMFYIASITKTYVATAFAVLAAEGRIRLDDPVKKYLPRFTLPDVALAERVTLRQLLSHEPGISAFPIVLLDAYTGEIDDDRYYHWLGQARVAGKVAYSNIHYTILGRVLEAVTGKPWGVALDELVLKPAGLGRTTALASRLFADGDHATPLRVTSALKFDTTPQRKTDATMHAAGGMAASLNDALRYLAWHIADGQPDGRTSARADVIRSMRQQQAAFDKPNGSYRITTGFGLGWQTGTYGGHPFVAHSGGYAGAAAYYAILPKQRAGFVILMNAGQSALGLADVIAIDLLNRLTGEALAPDLLKSHQQRMQRETEKLKSQSAVMADNFLRPAQLPATAERLAREYRSKFWGTLHLRRDGDGLRVSLGQLPLTFTRVEAGALQLADDPLKGLTLTIRQGEQDAKPAFTLTTRDWGDAVFEKQ